MHTGGQNDGPQVEIEALPPPPLLPVSSLSVHVRNPTHCPISFCQHSLWTLLQNGGPSNLLEHAKRTGYVFDKDMLLHRDPQEDHPEQPLRLTSILEQLQRGGLIQQCQPVVLSSPHKEFPIEAARLCHTKSHLDFVDRIGRTAAHRERPASDC